MPNFNDAQLYEIARMKYETLMTDGSVRKNDVLRATLPYLNRAPDPVIAEAIRIAFVDKKLYEFRKRENAAAFVNAEADGSLEAKLKTTFGLRKAVVIKWPPDGTALPADANEEDDLRAEVLGAAMARVLADAPDHGDRIGIAGGRCCYGAALVFRSVFANQTAEGVHVYALAGNFNVRSKAAREKNVGLDSSLNAYRLTNAWPDIFCYIEPLLAPALIADDARLRTYKADTWLGKHGLGKPNVGIVGLGGLLNSTADLSNFGRGLVDIARMSGDEKLIKRLELVMTLCKESLAQTPADKPPYQMISDCANRLCVVPPPPGYNADPKHLNEARAAVEAINKHLLVVSEADLLAMELNVVAGGLSKSVALHALLRHPGVTLGRPQSTAKPVRVLCTDSDCAQALLALDAEAKKVPALAVPAAPPPARTPRRGPRSRR